MVRWILRAVKRSSPAALCLVPMAAMIAIGVDPGTLHLGWGVVRREGSRVSHVAHGVIDLDPKQGLPARLARIADELDVILDRYRPQVAAVETLFFHRDAQAAASAECIANVRFD